MSYEVGSAFLQIVPSFSGVVEAIGAEAQKWGDEAGQIFAETFKSIVDAELKSISGVKIDADTSEAMSKIAAIKAEMETLTGDNIKVDLSDEDAQVRLAELQAELLAISAEHPTIRVNVDTGEASVEMAALGAETEALDAGLGAVGPEASGAGGGIGAMGASAEEAGGGVSFLAVGVVALGAALVPIGGLALGAFAALPAMIGGAATAIGALYLGTSGVLGAISAFMAPQTAPSGSSGSSAASTALSNATAERNAAYSVQQAEDALNNARISGAAAVTAAETAAGQAMVTANQNVINSEAALVNASRAVTAAQYNEQQAQQAVMAARQAAQFQLENYTNQLADGAIAQQQAALNLTIAQQNFASAMAPGTTATYDQQQQAQISLEQAQQAVTDLNTQNAQLATTASEAFAAGVEGSSQVMSAEYQLKQAIQAVSDTLAAQVTAQQNVATADMALANQVIKNEQAIYTAQINNAQGVQNAQKALQQALANQEDAFDRAAIPIATTTASVRNYATQFNALTPAGKEFVTFVTTSIIPAMNTFKDSVQGAFLPLITTGLKDLIPFFETWQPLILAAAKGIGDTFDQLAKFAGTQPGLGQLNKILEAGNNFMSQMGGNLVTIVEAITGIGSQGTPILTAIGDGITNMVNAFAKWAEGGGFQKFMTWLRENGPSLVSDLGNFIKAAGSLLVALAPLGVVLDDLIGWLSKVITWVTSSWQVFGNLSIALGVVGVAIAAAGGPITALIAGIALLVVGVVTLATHWQQVWGDIKNWALDAWHYLDAQFISPIVNFFMHTIPDALDAFVGYLTALPDRALHALGDFALKVWGGIVVGASWLTTNVADPIINFFKGIPTDIETAAKGMWHGISDAFADALNTIIGWWDDLHFTLPSVNLGIFHTPSFTLGLPQIPELQKFHQGGVVQGTPGVEQLALLMPGEVVTPVGVPLPSSAGGGSPIELHLTVHGADLSSIPAFEKVVTN
ncbi:MAG TPA: hypothetical protein VG815_05510, partial [Chloroflexota bacterium]|nr:hypothetical protein [Chloroflexota bacterium]